MKVLYSIKGFKQCRCGIKRSHYHDGGNRIYVQGFIAENMGEEMALLRESTDCTQNVKHPPFTGVILSNIITILKNSKIKTKGK